jgi:hypothetical protein
MGGGPTPMLSHDALCQHPDALFGLAALTRAEFRTLAAESEVAE